MTYIIKNGSQAGPFGDEYIKDCIRAGSFDASDQVWQEGLVEWVPLASLFPAMFPPQPKNIPKPPTPPTGQPASAANASAADAEQAGPAVVPPKSGLPITLYSPATGLQTPMNGVSALRHALENGTASRGDYVFYPGADGWKLLRELQIQGDRLIPLPALPPPVAGPPAFHDHSTSGRHNHNVDFGLTVRTKHNVMAYFCFGFGCLSFVLFAIAAIPGVICGQIALKQCKEDPSMLGKSWAVAGLSLSWLIITLNLIVLVGFVLFFAFSMQQN